MWQNCPDHGPLVNRAGHIHKSNGPTTVQATTGPVIQMVLAQVQEPGNGEFGILQISGSNLGCEAWPFASACSLPGNRKPMVVRINCLSVKQRHEFCPFCVIPTPVSTEGRSS